VPSFKLDAEVRDGLFMVASWLVVVNLFALLAFNRLNLAPDTSMTWMSPHNPRPVSQNWNLIDLHDRWDSYWYLDIAQKGYELRGEDDQANVVFFPLYPILVYFAGMVTGGNLVLAGWIISCIFLALSVWMLVRLTQEFHPDIHPLLPAVFLLVYPAAFFLNAVYSESMFLFLSLAMVLWARRGNFWLAGIFAGLASATRIAGVFLFVLLLAEFIQANGWRGLFTHRVWPLALAPVGIFAFFLHHWIVFGDFFLYLTAQRFYGRDFQMEASDFAIRNGSALVVAALDWFLVAAVILMGVIALLRLRRSYGMYMLVSLGVALASGSFLGAARYSMVLFPIHLIGAGIRSSVGRGAWLFGSTLLLALNIICFVNHYWAG
jgi:hypothetical protein